MSIRKGIVGYGYVGQATHKLIGDVDVIIDIDSDKSAWAAARESDIVFICVPTPQSDDGTCDTGIVEGVIKSLGTKPLYVIRSTIPWTFEMPGYRLVAAPEFLQQNKFLESTHVQLLGGLYRDLKLVSSIYDKLGIPYRLTTWKAAWQTKYTSNLYGAFKVSFWEMIQDITGNERLIYDIWKSLNINQGDMATVGMDGTRGFSGKCFPKDTNHVLAATDHELLRSIVQYNNKIKDNEKS